MSISGTLTAASADGRSDLLTYLGRIERLSPGAVVRLQAHASRPAVMVWAIALGTLVRREFPLVLGDRVDVAVRAADLAGRAEASRVTSAQIALPAAADAQWRGTIPPDRGWRHREDVPLQAVTDAVSAAGASLAELDDASASALGDSLLSQVVLTIDGQVELPLRTFVAASRMGFLSSSADRPNYVVRIASSGAWVVAATRLGAAYRRESTFDILDLL